MATEFSHALALLRKEKGLNQRTAAAGLGVSQALLSHYETGAREPGLSFVARACAFYGVSADFVLGRTMVREAGAANDDEGYDASEEKGNRVGNLSAAAILGRKLVINAVAMLFDIAGTSGNTAVIAELTNYFGASVYKMFRHFYEVAGVGNLFTAPNPTYDALAEADMATSEARMLSILHAKNFTMPELSNDSLTNDYPKLVRSLLTLTHQAGERAAKRLG